MDVIIVFVSILGSIMSGYDFPTLYFYISLSNALWKAVKRYTKDKTARR